ncbi:MAG: hypothetical protein KJ025_22730 [Burkholderiales bacterium]|nr:hypothetical protein [Burkholderiales bacterium]
MRRRHGSRRAEAFRGGDDPNRVYLVIDWESREAPERFRADPEVPPTMRSGGITAPPQFTFVEQVAELPG